MNTKNLKLTKLVKTGLLLIVYFLPLKLLAQNTDQHIDELINEGNFIEAIQVCKALLDNNADDPKINFKIGYCYMNTPLNKSLAIPFLEKSTEYYDQRNEHSAEELESRFYMGEAYHKNYEFEKALGVFQLMHKQVKNKEMLTAIEEGIEQCKIGIELKRNPVNMQVTNMGGIINTEYSDHSPVLSADESVIIFTSRRESPTNQTFKADGQYNEDIYISNFDGKQWTKPQGISQNINTGEHEASIGISADGQELFIYNQTEGGTILSSKLMGDEWMTPVKLGSNINTRWRETHASLSADGRFLYFTSDRPGGYGGLDIYMSEKQSNGEWGKAVNLGPAINTDKDEEGPFIHYDGITLYFSSKGHNTMGGYDIFSSKRTVFGTWSIPVNMGYPVNTTEDDAFFVMTADGKRAYYASYREGGLGSTDIFMMGLPEAEEIPLTIVKGVVSVCKHESDNVQITVTDEDTKEIVGIYKPNSKSGKYLFILYRGKNYKAVYQVNGKSIQTENFNISKTADFQVLYKTIYLKSGTPCDEYVGLENKEDSMMVTFIEEPLVEDPGKTYVENVMFKINNAEVTYFHENLKKLADYLKQHPGTQLDLIGYCDTQGPESYNLTLSTRRAKEVYQYLIKLGVDQNQLTYHGNGEKDQITINNYKDGSYVWQSLPYNRRVEFNVVVDTENKLVIKQFKIPKVYNVNNDSITADDFLEYDKKYTIQIGAFSKPISNTHFKNLKNIQMFYTGKYYHYSYGEYQSEQEALNELKTVTGLGYKDAFIRKMSFYFPDKLKLESSLLSSGK